MPFDNSSPFFFVVIVPISANLLDTSKLFKDLILRRYERMYFKRGNYYMKFYMFYIRRYIILNLKYMMFGSVTLWYYQKTASY